MSVNPLNLSNMKCEKMLTSKAAQTTISQTSIFLNVLQFLHVQTQLQRTTEQLFPHADPFLNNVRTVIRVINKASLSHLVRGLIAGVLQCQVHHGVLEGAAHVEFKGDVVHTLQFGQKGRNNIHSQKLSHLQGYFSVIE